MKNFNEQELTAHDVELSGYDPFIQRLYWFQERDKLLRHQLLGNPESNSEIDNLLNKLRSHKYLGKDTDLDI